MAVLLRTRFARRLVNCALKYQSSCMSSVPEPITKPDVQYAGVSKNMLWCNYFFWKIFIIKHVK